MSKIKNMGTATMRFKEGVIITGSAGSDAYALSITGSSYTSDNIIVDGRIGIGSSDPAYKLSVGGSMDIGEYIYHKGDTDTNIRLQTDQIDVTAGGKTMIKLEEGSQNKLSLGLDSGFGTDTFFSVSGSLDSQNLSVFGGDVTISGSLNVANVATYNTIEYFNSNTMKFNQNYLGNANGSYFSANEYQKVLTITPNADSQNYQVIGRITAQNAGETHIVYFNAALRSGDPLPDLSWSIFYDEEYNGSRYIDPQLWTKETTTAGFIIAFKTLGTIYGNVTVDIDVVPRSESQKANVVINNTISSEQTSIDSGFTANDMTKVISKKGQEITFANSFKFPTSDGNTNQVLTTDGSGNLTFATQATGSGANPPGGADRQIQFNDNGSFAGNYGILVDTDFNLKASGSLIAKESIGVGTDLGGGRNSSDEWVAITAPAHKFHVIGDNTEAATFSIDSAADSVGGSYWSFTKARGTPASPAGVNTNDEIARIQFFAHTGTSTLKRSAMILAKTDSDGDGRLSFQVTKEGDIDNVAIECYNNQVTIQDQMVIGSSGIIPISNGGASIGGSSNRFDYMRANNLVAYESLMLGGTHPIYDKAGFGIQVNDDIPIIGNYTSAEGLVYVSNSSAIENVIFALHKTGSHYGGIAINGTDANNDEMMVFFSDNNTAGFRWKNNIPYYNANGIGNMNTTGTTLMDLDKDANLLISGTMTVGEFTIPKTDGTDGQVLKTNGSGVLAWADDTSGSSSLTVGFSTIGGASGSVDHDCTSNQTFYHNYISGAISPNFTNLSISSGQATVTKLILDQGATPYAIDKVSIAGTEASLVWEGSRPSVVANAISFAKFEILRISNSYSVIGAFATTVAGGPVTIPSNALLFLDASNGNSYPGSGTTWTDLSGDGKHGTLVNSPTYNSTKKLFEFTGASSQHITVPSGFNDFSSGATFFVVADLGTGSSWERFFDFSVGGATNDAFNFGRKNTTTNLSLQFYHVEEGNANISLESNQISNNTLANYAITTDGTNARVYKNGVLVETIGFAATLSDVERNQNYIGRSRAGGNAYYEGDLAVAAIFNRTLSATEIADLYTYYSAVYDI